MTKQTEKLSEVERQNAVSVSDDQTSERGLWPRAGEWATIVTAAPIYHGFLVAITPCDYILREASWIPETGRLHEYVKNPNKTATEAEYIGELSVPRSAVLGVYKVAPGPVTTR